MWETIEAGSKAVWNNPVLGKVVSGLFFIPFRTIRYLIKQIPAIWRGVQSLYKHAPTQDISQKAVQIVTHDTLPALLVLTSARWIQNQSIAQHASACLLNTDTVLVTGLALIKIAQYIYLTRLATQRRIHSMLLTNTTATSLVRNLQQPPEKQSIFKRGEAIFQDLSIYYMTDIGLWILEYMPYVGTLAAGLRIYHNGRFITTLLLDLSYPQKKTYLAQYPELALSTGLSYKGLQWLTGACVGESSQELLEPLLILIMAGIVSNMSLPTPVKESTRGLDLFQWGQDGLLWNLEAYLIGVKEKVKHSKGEPIDWQKWLLTVEKIGKHTATQQLLKIIFPPILLDVKSFSHDLFVQPYWEKGRGMVIDSIIFIEKTKKEHWIKLNLASYTPWLVSKLAYWCYNIPEAPLKMALKLQKKQSVMRQLGDVRRMLQCMGTEKIPLPPIDRKNPSLREASFQLSEISQNDSKEDIDTFDVLTDNTPENLLNTPLTLFSKNNTLMLQEDPELLPDPQEILKSTHSTLRAHSLFSSKQPINDSLNEEDEIIVDPHELLSANTNNK